MLQWQVNDQSILFSFSDKDQRVPLRDIETQATGETFAQWIVLSEWLENGQAQETDNAIEVPCDEVVRLTECDRQVLQLPPLYPFEIVIRSKGAIHEPEFQFHWGFFEYEQGRQLSTSRTGCLLHLQDGSAYLLSEKQYALCQALDEFERQSAALRHPRGNWLRFAEIKARAEAAAAVLEPYLRGENVVVPHIIHLRVDRGEGDTIEIRPEIEGIDNPQFQRKFDRFPTPRDVYNLEDVAGNRTRVIPTEQQVQELKKIKSKRRIAGQEKRELLSHPQAVFDPEMVDLDQFSRRVMEIGIYHPRSYPFITPYKSQWIPGFCQEGKKVLIRSQEELAEFKTTVEKAVQNNQDHVTWKEATLALEDIQNIIQTAERQLACPERPAARDGESPETEHHCLIIYENVESLDYIEKSQGDISGGYRFFPVPHFREEVSILPHQQEGIAWLQTLYGKVPGVLLADDMGLGKTFQALSFLSWVHSEHNPENHPSLIVAPIALLENWVEEINKFFHPFAAVEMIQSEYFRIFNTQRKKYEGQLPFEKGAIYLTNYQILRNHATYFGREDWSVVILDEAQNIKTPGALVTNAAKALKSRFRVA
ncbi:MAG TPA: SNF2-related protein, partial [bacterium]|nr:SNF2-related protein [bacterium]